MIYISMTRSNEEFSNKLCDLINEFGGQRISLWTFLYEDAYAAKAAHDAFPDFRYWKFGEMIDGDFREPRWGGTDDKPFPEIIVKRTDSPNVKFYNLSNQNFEKQVETCAYCGCQIVTIVRKGSENLQTRKVPNDPQNRRVCKNCAGNTQMSIGSYGFSRHPSRFMTPMDKKNTVILGLEQEFEGYFYGWLELQLAHQGKLHYGYDSSIALDPTTEHTDRSSPYNGKNELSWDCGSYSWWKYASPLKPVCEVVKKYGGHIGASAGVHIHASFAQLSSDQMQSLARRSFELLQSRKDIQNLMLIVSGRSRERLDRWAYTDNVHQESREASEYGGVRKARYTDHHSCISFNRAGTVEFRCFSASLDHKEILKRMKFVKEYVTMVRNKVHPDDFIKSFSVGTKKFIAECQEQQIRNGNIVEEQKVI